jgi:predicted nucleic acid-binding protein
LIVYVESNFVLQIALGEEQSGDAENLLKRAESGQLEIAFPSFAMSEPFATVSHRGRERARLCVLLDEQLRQLQRSQPHAEVAAHLTTVPAILGDIEKKEVDLLESTVKRLLSVGKSIEMNSSVFAQALIYENQYGLSPQDSIIYSAVVSDLKDRNNSDAKYFVSTNWKDFLDPGITSELLSFNCTYVENFAKVVKGLTDGES